ARRRSRPGRPGTTLSRPRPAGSPPADRPSPARPPPRRRSDSPGTFVPTLAVTTYRSPPHDTGENPGPSSRSRGSRSRSIRSRPGRDVRDENVPKSGLRRVSPICLDRGHLFLSRTWYRSRGQLVDLERRPQTRLDRALNPGVAERGVLAREE